MSLGTRLAGYIDRAHERWRDPLLTALAALLILMMFVVAPLQAAHTVHSLLPGLVFVTLMGGGLLVVSRSLLPVAGVVTAVGLQVARLVLRQRGGHELLDVCLEATGWLIIAVVIIWVTGRAVFATGRVNYHRVIGAVLLYLAAGLAFAALYTFVGALSPGSFNGLAVRDHARLLSDLVYFSFVTLTTVGYGDISPLHPVARSLSNVEAVFGQLYPATLLARLVTLELQSRR